MSQVVTTEIKKKRVTKPKHTPTLDEMIVSMKDCLEMLHQ